MESPLEVIRLFPVHDFSLDSTFESRRQIKGDEPFILSEDSTISWHEFAALRDKFVQVLQIKGITRGTRVAVMCRNDKTHVLALFSLAKLGAILVPVNPDFNDREAGYILNHAAVDGIVCDAFSLDVVMRVKETLSHSPWLMTTTPSHGLEPNIECLWETLDRIDELTVVDNPGHSDDTCIIIYTSGTTGFPKGVMHSQRNLIRAGEANVERLHLQPEDRYLIVLPFFHVNAMFYSLGGVLASGSAMILVPRFSAGTFWDTAVRFQATVVNIIEAIGTILCNRDRSEYRDEHMIRAVYGVRKAAASIFQSDFGIKKLMSGFGMTEIPGVTCNPWEGAAKPASMGVLGRHPDPNLPWAQCRIVDDQRHDVEVGVTGELWVKTPIVMQGYFNDPEKTAQAFDDGWLKTGDIVKQDSDGYFFHIARKKDIIRRRGENISAVEVETVIAEMSGVYQAAAVAVPSELGEDDIMAVVVKQPNATLTAANIVQWCRGNLSSIKVPRFVSFIDSMPLTPTHKILKSALRDDPSILARAVDFQTPTQHK
jgi:crotonobetaine/carnitine-CoA ligase